MSSDNPFKELAVLLDGRINNHTSLALSGVHAELGTITPTGLKLDGFKHEISDYLVAEHLSMDGQYFTETVQGENVKTPDELKPLKPGDRVLCVPVGNEVVVVCRVV